MSKRRARYTGPFDEVIVWWPPGATVPEKEWRVQQNHWLPDDAPAALVGELVASDDWSEIEQSTPTEKGDE